MSSAIDRLGERLFEILRSENFLLMKGLANEVPLFIQAYDPTAEDALRRMVHSLAARLRSIGVTVAQIDLLDLVLEELEERGVLAELLEQEPTFDKADLLETLRNYSDADSSIVPRLMKTIGSGTTQLTLITGSGRVYPFLRTHSILESLQPAMLSHPIVILFPGDYAQDERGGSHLRLFSSIPSPRIARPYYRASNLDHFRI